ncbi:MAG: hypothetical protein C0518_10125 [Opitutus sp.]|nr:hypothetical protein [Opitutus sp.]
MRTRLCYLALILVPLVVYATAWFGDYGTAADFLRLDAASRDLVATDHAREGILNGALLDVSFAFVSDVADFRFARMLGVLLLVLCGLALWQLLERGGWSEFDATAAALSVVLLPTAQLTAGWGTTWPGTLAALLSLAGFAAVESELEQGGGRRVIAMLGGVLLYLAAAMCYFPGAIMALVPLAGLGFVRPARLWSETQKWFFSHVGLLLFGVLGAWLLERTMMSEAGVADSSSLVQRLLDLATHALPLAWAPYLAAASEPMHLLCVALALVVLVGLLFAIRQRSAADVRVGNAWKLVLGGAILIFCVVALLSPNWRSSYRSLWPMAGVAIIALVAAVRGLSDQTGGRPFWHHAAMVGIVAVGALAAFGQVHGLIAEPLSAEWASLRTAVLRANFPSEARVQLELPENKSGHDGAAARFEGRVAEHPEAAEQMFNAAMQARYPSGLPKGHRFSVEVGPAGAAPAEGVLVFDLAKPVTH